MSQSTKSIPACQDVGKLPCSVKTCSSEFRTGGCARSRLVDVLTRAKIAETIPGESHQRTHRTGNANQEVFA